MFLVSNKEMLLACAEAGILGTMPTINARSSEILKADLEWLRAKTDKPFGINFTIGLSDPKRLTTDLALCFEYEVPVLITSYGNPTEIVNEAHKRDITVFHDVINLKHAKKAESAGVDAIIGVTHGAGGHAGQVNPYVFLPYLRSHLDVPVIAAGCISGGEQVAAAMSLGAQLSYLGTRFIASAESGAQDAYKEMIVKSTHEDVVYTDKVSGIHANFLKDTIPDATKPTRGAEESKRWKDIWSAGQGVTTVSEIKPIADIVEDIVREYHDAVARLTT
jgi:nitronate monooxygenase